METREFEVQGEAKYVNDTFGIYIHEYLETIKGNHPPKKPNEGSTKQAPPATKEGTSVDELPDSFGEYLNKFPRTLKDVDRLLIAGLYVQSKNKNNFFTISEASNLLVDQGIKLSNSSAFNKANETTKRIFKLSGKNYRVSDSGIQYVKTLN